MTTTAERVEHRRTSLAASLGPRIVGVGILAAASFQVVQGYLDKRLVPAPFPRSLWYVTYESGFVRRGLAGEVLRRVVGHPPSANEIAVAQNALVVAALVVCGWLLVLLCRQSHAFARAAALVFVASPFGISVIVGLRRPELVAVIVLLLVVAWTTTSRPDPMAVGVVAGVAMGACALVSEAGPLAVAPWLALVVALNARVGLCSVPERWVALVAAVAPTIVALGVVANRGRATEEQVWRLEAASPWNVRGNGTIFPYLDDTLSDSVRTVSGHATPWSIVVAVIVWALVAVVARPFLRQAWSMFASALPGSPCRALWCAGVVGSTLVLYGLGFDWLRWAGLIGTAATIAVVAAALQWRRVPRCRAATRDVRFAPLSLAVAGVLLALPPLPGSVHSLDEVLSLLFFVSV